MCAKDHAQPSKQNSDNKKSKEPVPHSSSEHNLLSDQVQMDLMAGDLTSGQSPRQILQLQHLLGNRAVSRLIDKARHTPSPSPLGISQHSVQLAPVIQRVVRGDVTRTSINDSFAWALTDAELTQQIQILATESVTHTPGIIPEVIQQNKAILDREKARREAGLLYKPRAEWIARKAWAFRNNNLNEDKKKLSDAVLTDVNSIVPHPYIFGYATGSDSLGWFDQEDWSITLNPDKFSDQAGVTKVGHLSQTEVAEIVDTVYHEARHCEQAFHIAQMKAGRGKTAADLVTDMRIPKEVADHAYAIPFVGTTKERKFRIAQAISWDDVTARYNDYNNWLQSDSVDNLLKVFETGTPITKYNNLSPEIGAMENRIATACDASVTKVLAIAKKRRNFLDKTVLKYSRSARRRFNLLKTEYNLNKPKTAAYLSRLKRLGERLSTVQYAGYYALVYEIDARRAGAMAGRATRRQK